MNQLIDQTKKKSNEYRNDYFAEYDDGNNQMPPESDLTGYSTSYNRNCYDGAYHQGVYGKPNATNFGYGIFIYPLFVIR